MNHYFYTANVSHKTNWQNYNRFKMNISQKCTVPFNLNEILLHLEFLTHQHAAR